MKKKILILIKAAPLPSKNYIETVCTAGIDEDGNWYRLYPLPFRYIGWGQRFKKYQWIEVDLQRMPIEKDYRKESHRPKTETIKTLGKPIPTNKNWSERKKLVLPCLQLSVESLSDQFYQDGTSLGIIQSEQVTEFLAERDEEYWSQRKAIVQSQLRLFGPQPKELEKVPYKFYYKFKCKDPRCDGHKLSIHDWEIYMLYLNVKKNYQYAEDEVLTKVKEKWLDQMWSKSRESYLMLGTVHSRYKKPIWVVLGVFWPPKVNI